MWYWLLFSVLISLTQLWLVPLFYYLLNKPLTWVDLIGNGSLLLFATTLTSKTTGEYFKKVTTHHWFASSFFVLLTFAVTAMAVGSYALMLASRTGSLLSDRAVTPEKMTIVSGWLAATGLVFSLAGTIYIRRVED